MQRYHAIFHLARLVFAGSVAEMLAAVPSHLIVSRRPGCLVGLATAIGILSGMYVMIWSFGPAIFLLFLQAARREIGGNGGGRRIAGVARAVPVQPADDAAGNAGDRRSSAACCANSGAAGPPPW